VLKEGVGETTPTRAHRQAAAFSSTHTDREEQNVSLADYVSRMKEGRTRSISSRRDFPGAKNSPHWRSSGSAQSRCCCSPERVDEWLVANLPSTRANTSLGRQGRARPVQAPDRRGKKEEAKQAGEHRALVAKLKDALGDKVKDVRVSSRLTQSPSCLVADEHDMGAISRASSRRRGRRGRTPTHPRDQPRASDGEAARGGETRFADWASALRSALLAEGGQLDDPAGFVRR